MYIFASGNSDVFKWSVAASINKYSHVKNHDSRHSESSLEDKLIQISIKSNKTQGKWLLKPSNSKLRAKD